MNSILRTGEARLTRVVEKTTPAAPRRRRFWVKWLIGGLTLSTAAAASVVAIAWRCSEVRYDAAPAMRVPLEVAAADANYDARRLLLIQRDATHYDFILEPTDNRVARIVLANVDVSTLAPQVNATGYAARQPQQIAFDARDEGVEILGGDGFEAAHLAWISITSQHGHAKGWHIALAAETAGESRMYYRGEFQFPLGHYRELFEQVTGLNYGDYRRELEEPAPLVASELNEHLLR
jgi:hypothetical protein